MKQTTKFARQRTNRDGVSHPGPGTKVYYYFTHPTKGRQVKAAVYSK